MKMRSINTACRKQQNIAIIESKLKDFSSLLTSDDKKGKKNKPWFRSSDFTGNIAKVRKIKLLLNLRILSRI